jgi:hypothetical protein
MALTEEIDGGLDDGGFVDVADAGGDKDADAGEAGAAFLFDDLVVVEAAAEASGQDSLDEVVSRSAARA